MTHFYIRPTICDGDVYELKYMNVSRNGICFSPARLHPSEFLKAELQIASEIYYALDMGIGREAIAQKLLAKGYYGQYTTSNPNG